ncbi:uncharacterized protein LOC105187196 [Harpegnathos saltator]|uniref:Uncharacterized protein n=1 Tax=Harpegnathos saltator TaxID=610380 RepID=E2BW61_HARSA|nr:uncharacterized protein LOC105187196 [Harpegnathos saltator]EFN80093.1 hypothetical protein EAI_06512 [Harpegnathos saltator]
MATDVEESDTDEHERPIPPKRQCMRLSKVNETCWNTEQHMNINMEMMEDNLENNDYDEVERHAREKLKRWQAFQAAKGTMDNTVNKVLEDCNMITALDCLEEDLTEGLFRFFRENDMEDTAVMMAIRNYGLVQSVEPVSQSHDDKTPDYRADSDYIGVHCSFPSNHIQDIKDLPATLPTTSTNPSRLSNSIEMGRCNATNLDEDKIYDSDQPEDFLERAVAEAIKKKGLSALSVDY